MLIFVYMNDTRPLRSFTHAVLDPRRRVQLCPLSDEELIEKIIHDPTPPSEWLGHMLLFHTDQLTGFLAKLPPPRS